MLPSFTAFLKLQAIETVRSQGHNAKDGIDIRRETYHDIPARNKVNLVVHIRYDAPSPLVVLTGWQIF